MTKIEFVVNIEKARPPSPFSLFMRSKLSFKNLMKCWLLGFVIDGTYSPSRDETMIYLYNAWRAYEKRWKDKISFTRFITTVIDHEVLHRVLCKFSVPLEKHEHALDTIGIGQNCNDARYE